MRDVLIGTMLLPWLAAQALWVKRTIPRLPKAVGARCGHSGQGRHLRILLLGDSAAAGVGVEHQAHALIGQLVKQLQQRYVVDWQVVAQTGRTTADVTRVVRGMPAQAVDVVITSLGVNDITRMIPSWYWVRQQQQLLTLIQRTFSPQRILLSQIPPMHCFPALPQPLRWFLGSKAKRFNVRLQQIQRDVGRHNVRIVKLNLPVRPMFMASDGFHPSVHGYALWAERLVAQIDAMYA